MGILNNQKGQGPIQGIMMAVIGLIMLASMLPLINSVIGIIVGGNMSSFSNVATIQLLLGMVGIIIVVMVVYSSVILPFLGGGNQPQQGGF